MPEKSAICWSNRHTGTGDARSQGNIKSSEFSGFMRRRMWRNVTSHSLPRLLKNMPVFPLHARTHAHTSYISVLIDFGETLFENHAVFSLKPRDISSLFGICILLSTFFSNTFGPSDFLNMINDLSEQHETKYRRVQ